MSLKQYIKENEEMREVVINAEDVVQLLKEASQKLENIQKIYYATGKRTTDFLRFKSMVDEIISSDHGEAGLEPFVNMLFQETASKDNI